MADWIKCSERMPEIPSDAPDYAACVNVIAHNSYGWVRQMRWAENRYAKTEKGRAARWEEMCGRLAPCAITHWQPLPQPPEQE